MPLSYEEGPEEIEAREAEERRQVLMEARLRQAEAQQAARRAEMDRLREAMQTLEHADPATMFDLKCQAAVAGTDLRSQHASPPSLGGLPPGQMEEIARKQASVDAGWENELRARERWVADQEDVIKRLCAGQTDENQRQIRAQFNAQKARG